MGVGTCSVMSRGDLGQRPRGRDLLNCCCKTCQVFAIRPEPGNASRIIDSTCVVWELVSL